MNRWSRGEQPQLVVFSPYVFEALRELFVRVEALYASTQAGNAVVDRLPQSLAEFLREHDFEKRLDEIRTNVSSRSAFVRRFFRWFDAFKVFRFSRWASERYYEQVPIEHAVETLLTWRAPGEDLDTGSLSARDLLLRLRALDKACEDAPALQGTMRSRVLGRSTQS